MKRQAKVLEALRAKKNNWVDQRLLLEFVQDYTKLQAEISELKRDGWDIQTKNADAVDEVDGGVSVTPTVFHKLHIPEVAKGWTCTSCGDVYAEGAGHVNGRKTIDPRYQFIGCRRCKKQTIWRQTDDKAGSGKD